MSLNLLENSLFLPNWRERMRPASFGSAFILTVIVILIIYTNVRARPNYVTYYDYAQMETHCETAYSNPKALHQNKEIKPYCYQQAKQIRKEIPWTDDFFLNISVLQGVIILFFGSIMGLRTAARERLSGTLDFHRSSPTPVFHQAVGLILGSACLEWCLVFFVFLIQLGLVLFTPLSLMTLLKFIISLICCAIFFHCLTVLFGLAQVPSKNRSAGLFYIIGIYIIWHVLALSFYNPSSFIYHLGFQSGYDQLYRTVHGLPQKGSYLYSYYGSDFSLRYKFFDTTIPNLPFQMFVQVPFMAAAVSGIMRKILKPDRPLLSKPTTLLISFYILFLHTGSTFPQIFDTTSNYYFSYRYPSGSLEVWSYLLTLCVALGILGTLVITPTRLSYMKGLRRSRKLGLRQLNSSDDQSSNVTWLLCFCFAVSIVYFIFAYIYRIMPSQKFLGWVLLLIVPVFFAQALEYFHLSRYHTKPIIFWTTMIILWILLPIFAAIFQSITPDSTVTHYLMAFSPINAVTIAVDLLAKNKNIPWDKLTPAFFVNASLCVASLYLAAKARREVIQSIDKS